MTDPIPPRPGRAHPAISRAVIGVVLGSVLATGCTTMTTQQKEDREYKNLLHKRKFLAYRQECRRDGRTLVVDARNSLGRDGIPGRGDYYYCR